MMDDSRRLKRGLKDVSPLFSVDEAPALSAAEPRGILRNTHPLQSVSVFCPHRPELSRSLSDSLMTQFNLLGQESMLLSVVPGSLPSNPLRGGQDGGLSYKRMVLTQHQLDHICHSKAKASGQTGASVLFFDFDPNHPVLFRKIIPMLDKSCLFLTPDLESLTEGLKLIKASSVLNPRLEYFAAYEGPDNPQKAAMLYERFSDIVSRRVGVSVNWLGSFDRTRPVSIAGIAIESLQPISVPDTLEKRALAGWMDPQPGAAG